MSRIVVRHPDGRRVSVLESEYDEPRANPYNLDRVVVSTNGQHEARTGRSGPEYLSLRAEGFVPVGTIGQDGHEYGLGGG